MLIRVLSVAALALLAGWTPPVAGFDRVTGATHASRPDVIAARGMVATSQPLATQVGLQVLKDGGNAIDAAIAANAAIGLMEPTGNGIGGDLFAMTAQREAQTPARSSGTPRPSGSMATTVRVARRSR